MLSGHTGKATSSQLTTVLTGASAALGVAREAADAVPIVKQMLGAALRIVGLAEKMDKDREALRELGAGSLQLARQVRDVMDGNNPGNRVQAPLERIMRALDSIETFMTNHATHSRLRRFISYAFTIPQHTKRLSDELANAVRDLTVVVLLATHVDVQDNARFLGKFRLLRDCEVQKLDLISEDICNTVDSKAIIRYHRALVDGQLLVVRYVEGGPPQDSLTVHTSEETAFHRITSNDRIMEEISSVRASHSNVARIYGRSKGSNSQCFTVFKSGFRPVWTLLDQLPHPVTTLIHCAFKLLVKMNYFYISNSDAIQDAVQHLERMGIAWSPQNPPYVLDDHLEPTIGLQNDLSRIDPNANPLSMMDDQIYWLTDPLWFHSELQEVQSADVQAVAECHNQLRLTNLLGEFEAVGRRRWVILRDDFSQGKILNQGAAEGLLRVLKGEILRAVWPVDSWMWVDILLALAQKCNHQLQRGLQVVYTACMTRTDYLLMHGVVEDSKRIMYDLYFLNIPDTRRDEVRELLGILAPGKGEGFVHHRIARGRPSMYHSPK